MSEYQFTWRDEKFASNLRKHKVSFLRAVLIFENEIFERIDNREDYGEVRYIALGRVHMDLYRVVYTRPDDTTIHIISAQKANKHEQKDYHRQIHTQ